MTKTWRFVLTVVIFLAAAGIVLMGAAWLTGASVTRIVELVFGGADGVEAWWKTAARSGREAWEVVRAMARNLLPGIGIL